MKKYISDIINNDEIAKWKPGERILITAQTGSGKSFFVKNNIYEYCKTNNLKCLLLSNRSLLKNQNESGLGDKTEIIKPLNYQKLENQMLNGKNIFQVFAGFDIIVYDEVHYIFTDAIFSRNTDLLIEPVKHPLKDKIFIFITATPIALLEYQSYYEYVYTIPQDYSYIKNIFFYKKNVLPEAVFQRTPKGEKVLYFASDAIEALELSEKFHNASFVCAESNKLFGKSDKETRLQIENESKFYSKFLCTTKVLDNGINIIDKQLKHIIIDMLDPVTFIQCLGRKRVIDEDDQINLYIRDQDNGTINFNILKLRSKLRIADEMDEIGIEKFQEEYRKKDFDAVVDNDFKINEAKRQCYKTQLDVLETMFKDEEKQGYKKYICNLLDFEIEKVKNADREFEKMNLHELMEKVCDKKLFEEAQELFKEQFFRLAYGNPVNTDVRKRGLKTINAILEEDGEPFYVTARRETSGENKRKTYWIAIRMDSVEQSEEL